MEKIDRAAALHYFWKKVCEGWHLVERDDLSVIAEKMPPRTAEDMHYHQKARQFFYVLSGQAAMRFIDRTVPLNTGDGLEISPGEAHQMCNQSDDAVEFLVVSMPKAHGDKIPVKTSVIRYTPSADLDTSNSFISMVEAAIADKSNGKLESFQN